MQNSITQAIAAKFAILSPLLDERARRLWAAVEACGIGRGGSGWVSVGIDHDTAEFAVETSGGGGRTWASQVYPQAKRLLITADAGGSNGSRCRLWKVALQQLADEIGLRISVCHFPPGTSKWNKIEHRMFCHITENWRGRPLVSREVVVNLIGHTTTEDGLAIRSELDENRYPTGPRSPRSRWRASP